MVGYETRDQSVLGRDVFKSGERWMTQLERGRARGS